MYIYWKEISHGHMREILDNERWNLYCNCDEHGYDCLNLRIGEDIHCVCGSDYWTQGRAKLDSFYVGEYCKYFTEVVKNVFEIVAKDAPEYIDLANIQEQVMEPFWR